MKRILHLFLLLIKKSFTIQIHYTVSILRNLIYRLPKNYTHIVVPFKYHMILEMPEDIEKPNITINYEYKASIDVVDKTSKIIFHSPELNSSMHIHKASFNKFIFLSYSSPNVTPEIYYGIPTYEHRTQLLIFSFETPLPSGMYTVIMTFNNTLRDNKGFFKTSYTNLEGKRM